jgi:hypothetical protein
MGGNLTVKAYEYSMVPERVPLNGKTNNNRLPGYLSDAKIPDA